MRSAASSPRHVAARSKSYEIFEQALDRSELSAIGRLTSPQKIQAFLDSLSYPPEDGYRTSLRVLRERTGQCFDSALFAAAMLRRLGYPPLVINLLPNNRDDDHVLALYKSHGYWGALAKSNFAGLRFREPAYRTLRELVMSYFELYYNVAGEKTLRGYTRPLNLIVFDRLPWMTEEGHIESIADRLDETGRTWLLSRKTIAGLSPVDERSYRAGLSGAVAGGLYQPPKKVRKD